MPKVRVETSDAERTQAWHEKLWRDTDKKRFFEPMCSTNGQNICHRLVNDSKGRPVNGMGRGDIINYHLKARMNAGFLDPGVNIEGNETDMTVYSETLTMDQYRFAIRDSGPMHRLRPVYNLTEEMRDSITRQTAENIDKKYFDALIATNTLTFYEDEGVFKGTSTLATAKAGIHSTDLLNPEFLTKLKHTVTTKRTDNFIPLRGVYIDGQEFFVFLTHPNALADLENDSTFMQGRREALERSKSNPIFTGAWTVWNGIIVKAHENVPIGTTSGVPWAHSHLMGQQALADAWALKPTVVEKKFDYDEEIGIAVKTIWEVGKPQFNSADYGSVGVIVSRSQTTDVTIS